MVAPHPVQSADPAAQGSHDAERLRPSRRPWSLSARVTLLLGVAAVMPILGSAVYVTSRNQAEHQATARAHIRGVATRLCTAADVHLDKHRAAIAALGASMYDKPLRPSETIHGHLASTHRVYPGFLTMLVARHDGVVVSASPQRTPDGGNMLERLTRVDDRPYFIVPMRDHVTYVSEVFVGRGFGADPIVAISAPIEDATGRAVGIVEGSLDVRAFQALGSPRPGAPAVDYVIVDRQDRVIFSSAAPLPALTSIGDGALVRASRAETGSGFFTYQADAAAGTSPDRHLAARCVTGAGWTIFATQSLAPIEAESARQYGLALAWTLLALAATAVLAMTIARSVTRPLDTLTAAVSVFHPQGALPSIVRTGSEPAEVALLLDRFNEMAHRANESDRGMHRALDESRHAQTALAQVLSAREFEVRQRTAELAARSEELTAANARLEQLANADPLTGIANRRAVMTSLDMALRSAVRERLPVSVLAIDVDHFKAFNDAFGHPAGDDCLKRVAQVVAAVARRPLDRAGRTGGEEFVAVLHAAPADAALRIGEKLRGAVESLGVPHPASASGRVTVSLGVVTLVPDAHTVPSDLLDLADAALYDAKRAGRNRVVVAAPGRPAEADSPAA